MKSKLLRALGQAIHIGRTSLSFSQEELAQRAGLHRAYISEIERGERNPSLRTLGKLAEALNVPFATLCELAEELARDPSYATRVNQGKFSLAANASEHEPIDLVRMKAMMSQLNERIAKQDSELSLYFQVFESVPTLVWVKDAENRILRLNSRAAHSLGLRKDQIEGHSTYDLYPAQAAKYHRDDLEVITTNRPKYGIIETYTPISLAHADTRWVRTDKIPMTDDRGKPNGVIVFSTDITDMELTVAALREARDAAQRKNDIASSFAPADPSSSKT